MEELERDELHVCPLCGVAPTIGLGFDKDRNYIVEVKCDYCDIKVIGDNIETARAKWNKYVMLLDHFVTKMGYRGVWLKLGMRGMKRNKEE